MNAITDPIGSWFEALKPSGLVQDGYRSKM